MPLTSAFGRQVERNLYEFDTSLVDIKRSSHPGYIMRPYLKIFFKKEERDGEERRGREGRREGVRKGGREGERHCFGGTTCPLPPSPSISLYETCISWLSPVVFKIWPF